MTADKSPIDRLLDAAVFAPLGLALRREQAVAELATAGRKQVAFCRSLGRAAIKGLARGPERSSARSTEVKGAKKPASSTPSDGAVDGYGDLTAREVIAKLPTCTAAELAWIRTTEKATKKRVTVLRAVDARD